MKCSFLIADNDEDLEETFQWLRLVGITKVKAIEDIYKFGLIDVELKDTPFILEFFSQLEVISICKITNQGISFYVTNIPLGIDPDVKSPISSGNPDGIIFCPMSNIKTINTFGTLRNSHDISI